MFTLLVFHCPILVQAHFMAHPGNCKSLLRGHFGSISTLLPHINLHEAANMVFKLVSDHVISSAKILKTIQLFPE